jgi:hypothetical protein
MFNYDPEQRCDGNNIQPIYIKGKNLHLISEPTAIFAFFSNIYHQFFALQNNFYTLQQYIIGS